MTKEMPKEMFINEEHFHGAGLLWQHSNGVKYVRADTVKEVKPISGISLGSEYLGKITEQEAVDLINTVIESQLNAGEPVDASEIDGTYVKQTVKEFLEND